MRITKLRAAAILTATLIVSSACGSDSGSEPSSTSSESASTVSDSAPMSAPSGGRPMIVDYSPTLSDVPALMFLATHPDVDLLAVTLPGTGEADCGPGVRQTRALLVIAGHPDTPVGCGRDEPMEGDRDWPDAWRDSANNLPGVALPGVAEEDPVDAEELLARILRDAEVPVTIVTLAPLTNLGNLFRNDPSLADHVHSIVTMGGAVDVAGNVDTAPTAEWNLYIDPESVRAVLDSGVPITFVGLDATSSVPGSAGIYARLEASASTAAGEAVRQLWSAGLDLITSDGWFFWDELAAVIAVDASVATISEHNLSIDDDGATVVDEGGTSVRVATAADPAEFERLFLEVFAGEAIAVVVLTPTERGYIGQIAATMAALDASLGRTGAGRRGDARVRRDVLRRARCGSGGPDHDRSSGRIPGAA